MNLNPMRTNNRQIASGLGLLVFLFILSAVVPVDAANYDPKKPLPHKQQVNSQPAGDEDPWDEDFRIGGGGITVSRVKAGFRLYLFRQMGFLSRDIRYAAPSSEKASLAIGTVGID